MIIVLAHERVSSINEHTYNSLILHHSTRLIESIRSSSCLIKILHYWMLKSSSTRKPHSRNARGKFSRAKRVAKQWNFRNFSTTLAIFKRFSIWLRKIHLLYVNFSLSTCFQIIESLSLRYNLFVLVCLFTTTFEVRRNKFCEYLH